MVQHRLRREIIIALSLKVAALLALFTIFFAPSMRPDVEATQMSDQLLGGRAP